MTSLALPAAPSTPAPANTAEVENDANRANTAPSSASSSASVPSLPHRSVPVPPPAPSSAPPAPTTSKPSVAMMVVAQQGYAAYQRQLAQHSPQTAAVLKGAHPPPPQSSHAYSSHGSLPHAQPRGSPEQGLTPNSSPIPPMMHQNMRTSGHFVQQQPGTQLQQARYHGNAAQTSNQNLAAPPATQPQPQTTSTLSTHLHQQRQIPAPPPRVFVSPKGKMFKKNTDGSYTVLVPRNQEQSQAQVIAQQRTHDPAHLRALEQQARQQTQLRAQHQRAQQRAQYQAGQPQQLHPSQQYQYVVINGRTQAVPVGHPAASHLQQQAHMQQQHHSTAAAAHQAQHQQLAAAAALRQHRERAAAHQRAMQQALADAAAMPPPPPPPPATSFVAKMPLSKRANVLVDAEKKEVPKQPPLFVNRAPGKPCGMVITAIRPKPESEKSKPKSKSSKSSKSASSKSKTGRGRGGGGRSYGGRISARERVQLDRHTDMFIGRKKEENRPKGKSNSWWMKKYLNDEESDEESAASSTDVSRSTTPFSLASDTPSSRSASSMATSASSSRSVSRAASWAFNPPGLTFMPGMGFGRVDDSDSDSSDDEPFDIYAGMTEEQIAAVKANAKRIQDKFRDAMERQRASQVDEVLKVAKLFNDRVTEREAIFMLELCGNNEADVIEKLNSGAAFLDSVLEMMESSEIDRRVATSPSSVWRRVGRTSAPSTPTLPSNIPPEPLPLEQPRPIRHSPRGASPTSFIDTLTSSLQSSSTRSASSSSTSMSMSLHGLRRPSLTSSTSMMSSSTAPSFSSTPKFSVPRRRFYKSVRFKLTESKETEIGDSATISSPSQDTLESTSLMKTSKQELRRPRSSGSSLKEAILIEGSDVVTSVRMVMSTFCPLEIDKEKSRSSSSSDQSDFFSVFSPCLSPPLSSEKKAKSRSAELKTAEVEPKVSSSSSSSHSQKENDKGETAADIDSLFADVSLASSPQQKPQTVPLPGVIRSLPEAMDTDEDVSPVASAVSSPQLKPEASPVVTESASSPAAMDTGDDISTTKASPKKKGSPKKPEPKKKRSGDPPSSPAVMTRAMRAKARLSPPKSKKRPRSEQSSNVGVDSEEDSEKHHNASVAAATTPPMDDSNERASTNKVQKKKSDDSPASAAAASSSNPENENFCLPPASSTTNDIPEEEKMTDDAPAIVNGSAMSALALLSSSNRPALSSTTTSVDCSPSASPSPSKICPTAVNAVSASNPKAAAVPVDTTRKLDTMEVDSAIDTLIGEFGSPMPTGFGSEDETMSEAEKEPSTHSERKALLKAKLQAQTASSSSPLSSATVPSSLPSVPSSPSLPPLSSFLPTELSSPSLPALTLSVSSSSTSSLTAPSLSLTPPAEATSSSSSSPSPSAPPSAAAAVVAPPPPRVPPPKYGSSNASNRVKRSPPPPPPRLPPPQQPTAPSPSPQPPSNPSPPTVNTPSSTASVSSASSRHTGAVPPPPPPPPRRPPQHLQPQAHSQHQMHPQRHVHPQHQMFMQQQMYAQQQMQAQQGAHRGYAQQYHAPGFPGHNRQHTRMAPPPTYSNTQSAQTTTSNGLKIHPSRLAAAANGNCSDPKVQAALAQLQAPQKAAVPPPRASSGGEKARSSNKSGSRVPKAPMIMMDTEGFPIRRKKHAPSVPRLMLDSALSNPLDQTGWSEARKKAFSRIDTNPNSYYYRFNKPGETQTQGAWSDEEEQLFFQRIHDVGIGNAWGVFAMEIPGRTGYQCSNFYRKLIKEGRIVDPNYTFVNGKLKHKKVAGSKRNSSHFTQQVLDEMKQERLKNQELGTADPSLISAVASTSSSSSSASIGGPRRTKVHAAGAGGNESGVGGSGVVVVQPKKRRRKKAGTAMSQEEVDGFMAGTSSSVDVELDADLALMGDGEVVEAVKRASAEAAKAKAKSGSGGEANGIVGNDSGDETEDSDVELTPEDYRRMFRRWAKSFTDPITNTKVLRPTISPHGHVMGYNTWTRILNEEPVNTCPFTKKEVKRRQLVKLDEYNFHLYHKLILNV